ncbi:MAG: hypothetical protein GWN82_03710, partial [Gemmatimonadetes bacterium]|nr:hypothetical protein [Gemmatimonadota bacterium]NIU29854.1 hypothetical protein [Gemmatimonadota bacterium]NIV60542.1 hypothetical protein [Gemmatimonadota bacterium]NIW62924.1 hypothetical protein [Gemmatimonadota bacterium]
TLAGLCGLFSRMSGEVDLSVVAPVSNRGPVESRGLIGPVLNLVIFRTDLSGDPSFRKTVVAARRN